MIKKPFDGFAVKKEQGRLFVIDFGGYETRNPSTLALIEKAIKQFSVKDFGWIMINTSDREAQLFHEGLKVFAYSTMSANFAHACPDFVYDHWRQTGLLDYEQTRLELAAIASPPLTDMLGWRGAPTNPARDVLVELDDKKDFDCELIHRDRSDPNNLQANNFVSFHDQIARWRYLIDIEGTGYSGRFKLLLSSPRLVFLQDRPHKEDFFQHLVAWTHYVPVKRDLSDLRANLAIIKADPELETRIIQNAREFSRTYLSRASALQRWSDLLNSQPTPAAA
jgi:Glycosyl transferase family 90